MKSSRNETLSSPDASLQKSATTSKDYEFRQATTKSWQQQNSRNQGKSSHETANKQQKSIDTKATRHQKSSQQETKIKASQAITKTPMKIMFSGENSIVDTDIDSLSACHTHHSNKIKNEAKWCQVNTRSWPWPAHLKSSNNIAIRSQKWSNMNPRQNEILTSINALSVYHAKIRAIQ